MRKEERSTVAGIQAPRPRPTIRAALLVAAMLCLVFLSGLALWRLAALLLG